MYSSWLFIEKKFLIWRWPLTLLNFCELTVEFALGTQIKHTTHRDQCVHTCVAVFTRQMWSPPLNKINSPLRSQRFVSARGTGAGPVSYLLLPPSICFTHCLPCDIWCAALTAWLLTSWTLTQNKWRHKEDTRFRVRRAGGWGVKLLRCKIALAAVLLFQYFMVSCSASVPTCLLTAFSAEFSPSSIGDVTIWTTVIIISSA